MEVRERRRVSAIAEVLATYDPGQPDAISPLIPEIRALLGSDNALFYSWVERLDGWQIDRWHSQNIAEPFERAFRRLVGTRVIPAYDPADPPVAMRNRVVEATAAIGEDTWRESSLCQALFVPLGMERHRHLRALICDGDHLLGWIGTLCDGEPSPRQRELLGALVTPLYRRLAFERRIADGDRAPTLLALLLGRLAAPAVVIDAAGAIVDANPGARALLQTRRADVVAGVRGEPSPLRFERTRVADGSYLAVLADAAAMQPAVAHAAERWRLTPRQRDVLAALVAGDTNRAIATQLQIGNRAVELHVSALLDRAGVENRTALVAAVLAGSQMQ